MDCVQEKEDLEANLARTDLESILRSLAPGWREQLNETMVEQLDIALEGSAKAKFLIKNAAVGHDTLAVPEISYNIRGSD